MYSKEEKVNLKDVFREFFVLKEMIDNFPEMCDTNALADEVKEACEYFGETYLADLEDIYYHMLLKRVGPQGILDFMQTTELHEQVHDVAEEFENMVGEMVSNRINRKRKYKGGVH